MSEIKVSAGLGAGEKSPLGCRLPTPHCVLTWYQEAGKPSGVLKGTNLIHGGSALIT